jgi:uroporphyrinogen decarboxylase
MEGLEQMKGEKMTSAERLNALLAGQHSDRVPLIPFILGFCARNVGYPVSSIYNDPERSFWAQLWTQEQYGYDGYPIYGYASYGSWEFGGEVRFPSSDWEQAPSAVRFPVDSEEDVKKLELPDLKKAGMLPLAMEFSKISERVGISFNTVVLGGPFTVAGNLCKVEMLCRWMIRKPELVHKVLRLTAEHIVEVVRCWAHTFGVERLIPCIWEPSTANQIISPKQFKDFVFPYQKEVHERILAMGVKHILCHICGEHNLNLPHWAQIPMGDPGIVSVGHEVDLITAIKYFGKTSIIAGNIEPRVIQTGTPQEVYDLCKEAIAKAKYAPRGYILMAACEVPVMAPPYHIYVMKKAISDHGWYH